MRRDERRIRLLILRQYRSLPEPGKGLDSRADAIEGGDANAAGRSLLFCATGSLTCSDLEQRLA